MTKLIVPTRNRSTALLGLMNYLEWFYPGTELIIADGSNEFHKSRNAANVQTLKKTRIDYRPYAEELAFFERLVDVVKSETDEYLIIGSDDDFPMMEVFAEGEAYLREHPECVTALGGLVSLYLKQDDNIQARLNPARNLSASSVEQRVKTYSLWPVTTSYAVTRREILIERYERHCQLYLAGFYDFVVGVHDATRGTLHAIPTIGYFTTRNYNHAYWRAEDDLIFLRRAETVLKIIDVCKQDLMHFGSMQESEAKRLAEQVVSRRISEHLGNSSIRRKGFAHSPIFQNPAVQEQWRIFQNLFLDGTDVRKKYQDKLAFISESLMKNAKSQDNAGEPKKSETMIGRSQEVLAGSHSSSLHSSTLSFPMQREYNSSMTMANASKRNASQESSSMEASSGEVPIEFLPELNADDDVEMHFDVDPATMLRKNKTPPPQELV